MRPRRRRVLVVDDSPEDRETFKRHLLRAAPAGYEFVESASGEEAIEVCRSERPDCVLLDYRLPGADGLELLHALADPAGDIAVPVVMLTGSGTEPIAVEAMKRGASDYLAKESADPESLHRAVQHAIERAGWRRSLADRQEELRQFAYTAAHDLRSPLNQVSTFCQLLGDAQAEGDRERSAEYLGHIDAAVRRMSDLIDSLLAYAEHGWSAAPTEPVDLETTLAEVRAGLEARLRETGAVLEHDPLPVVLGHGISLQRLFQNLLANAIKFHGERPPRIRVRNLPVESGAHLVFEDGGIGIPVQHRQVVFEPFRRLHGKGHYEGSGLGLAICKRIASRHGGTIWVEEAPTGGAAIHVRLGDPLAPGAPDGA
jgi:signal transduction histidine kinase